MKKINDYLHLYLGCEYLYGDDDTVGVFSANDYDTLTLSAVKPILRHLSDISEEELKEWGVMAKDICLKYGDNVDGSEPYFWFEYTRYLLSKHFDLFDLIESGLAIDKTKIAELAYKNQPEVTLNDAAVEYCGKMRIARSTIYVLCYDAFIAGFNWHEKI